MNRYVLKYPDGRYVAMDEMSGGCPCPVDSVFSADHWATPEAADSYRRVGNNDFSIHMIVDVVTAPVEEVVVPTVVFRNPASVRGPHA